MTREEKELLLIDLCARLPYGVKVRTNRGPEIIEGLAPFCHNEVKIALNLDWSLSISAYTPYLRPMSSMTFEETREFLSIGDNDSGGFLLKTNKQDWLNAHHFDYRGLIEKGLAIEASDGMYK